MPKMFHMNTDLVCTTSLEFALYQRHITETFQYFIMGNCILAVFTFGIGIKDLSESLMSSYMRDHGSAFFGNIPPNQSDIMAMNSMIKKFFCQAANCFFSFSKHHQSTRVFINAMHKSKSGQLLFSE